MISPRALHAQRFMSLRERVDHLWDDHSIQISYFGLITLYRRYGIKNTKARAMKKHLIAQQERYFKIRAECAWNLLSLIINNEPIVYVDETSFYLNHIKSKTW